VQYYLVWQISIIIINRIYLKYILQCVSAVSCTERRFRRENFAEIFFSKKSPEIFLRAAVGRNIVSPQVSETVIRNVLFFN
jgi:hypothetical protein